MARRFCAGGRTLSGQKGVERLRGRKEIDAVFEVQVRRHRVARGVKGGQDSNEWPRGIGTWDGD